MVSLD